MIPKVVIQLHPYYWMDELSRNTEEYFQNSRFPRHILMISLKTFQNNLIWTGGVSQQKFYKDIPGKFSLPPSDQ